MRLNIDAFKLVEVASMGCLGVVEELSQNDDPFLQPCNSLIGLNADDGVLQRLSGALLVRSAQANHQQRPSAGEDIQAGPLMGQYCGVAMDKSRHAPDSQTDFLGYGGKSRQQRHRFQARLCQQAVSDPNGVKSPGVFALPGNI
jgi:hypothetical protein